MDAVVKVPTGISHDANIELVKEALQTPRLHEQINGPWKMKGKNAGDQFNGVLVVRVKSKQQYEHMKTALREIEEDIGKTCIFPDPDWSKLPAFKPMKISIVPVNNGEHVRADGATYNLRSFLGLIGFEWRRADNFARQFVKARHWHEPDGTRPHMSFHKGQAKAWQWPCCVPSDESARCCSGKSRCRIEPSNRSVPPALRVWMKGARCASRGDSLRRRRSTERDAAL